MKVERSSPSTRVVCKKNSGVGYYSNITVGKEYTLLPPTINHGGDITLPDYHLLRDDDNKEGLFLKEYFYTTQELREIKLNNIL
jgi:hypothetical protein